MDNFLGKVGLACFVIFGVIGTIGILCAIVNSFLGTEMLGTGFWFLMLVFYIIDTIGIIGSCYLLKRE